MPTDFWFRLSTYLSLVLACLCLGYAEWELLREVTAFTAVVIVLLVVSFVLDRRFELSLAKANALGLGIGVAAVVWVAWHLTNPPREGPLADVEWPTNMLPLIGPVLMTLIPAKLFRPKHVGDWWAMHGVAVAAVALASSMADDGWFMGLLAAYSVCSGWALVLFFYRRSGGFLPPVPNRPAPPQAQLAPADPDLRPPRGVFVRTLLWVAAGAAITVPLFLALPREKGMPWTFSKHYYVTGDSGDNRLVMNKSGELTESDEVAFRVTVTDAAGNPKSDLDPDQHWRGREFSSYEYDKDKREWAWGHRVFELTYPFGPGLAVVAGGPGAINEGRAAEFGPDGYAIEFGITAGQKTAVLAVPVRWQADRTPVRWANGDGWRFRQNATVYSPPRVMPPNTPPDRVVDRYTQVNGPGDDTDLGSPFELSPAPLTDLSVDDLRKYDRAYFREAGDDSAYVREYARDLLGRLVAAGTLPPAARRGNDRMLVPEAWHAEVARAFAAHLRESGEFAYTTSLEAKDRKLDPLVDFLKNGKAGHCEWFAGSLVLLLRAVGIPAQLVTGYRGWEVDEEGGLVVRQKHAHAWVEALVSRPAPAGYAFHPETVRGWEAKPERKGRVWHWLTLDPTPGTTAAPPPPKNWLEQGASLIAEFFLRYDRAKQQKAVEEVTQAGTTWGPAAVAVAAGLLAAWMVWRWWRRAARTETFDGPDWYGRFQAVLAAHGFRRSAGQTPREFADATAAALYAAGHPAADVLQFVTSKLYRVRYAGSPLKPDEVEQMTAALAQLEQKLAKVSPPTGGTP